MSSLQAGTKKANKLDNSDKIRALQCMKKVTAAAQKTLLDEAADSFAKSHAIKNHRIAFKLFMINKKLKAASWARIAGLKSPNVIYNFLNSHTESFSMSTLLALLNAVPGATLQDIFETKQNDKVGRPTEQDGSPELSKMLADQSRADLNYLLQRLDEEIAQPRAELNQLLQELDDEIARHPHFAKN